MAGLLLAGSSDRAGAGQSTAGSGDRWPGPVGGGEDPVAGGPQTPRAARREHRVIVRRRARAAAGRQIVQLGVDERRAAARRRAERSPRRQDHSSGSSTATTAARPTASRWPSSASNGLVARRPRSQPRRRPQRSGAEAVSAGEGRARPWPRQLLEAAGVVDADLAHERGARHGQEADLAGAAGRAPVQRPPITTAAPMPSSTQQQDEVSCPGRRPGSARRSPPG